MVEATNLQNVYMPILQSHLYFIILPPFFSSKNYISEIYTFPARHIPAL